MAKRTTKDTQTTQRSAARARVRGGKRAGKPRTSGSGQLPDTITAAMDWAFRAAIRGTHQLMRTRDEVGAQRQRIVDAAQQALGKLNDAAYSAQASGLADWRHVRDLDEPPDDSIAIVLWLVARLVRVVQGALAGDYDDPEEHRWTLREVRSIAAKVGSQPIDARVNAYREIREGRATAMEASGPSIAPAVPRKSLRC